LKHEGDKCRVFEEFDEDLLTIQAEDSAFFQNVGVVFVRSLPDEGFQSEKLTRFDEANDLPSAGQIPSNQLDATLAEPIAAGRRFPLLVDDPPRPARHRPDLMPEILALLRSLNVSAQTPVGAASSHLLT
jgi:hypothetical protein